MRIDILKFKYEEMKFKIKRSEKAKHDLVACVGWSNMNELFR